MIKGPTYYYITTRIDQRSHIKTNNTKPYPAKLSCKPIFVSTQKTMGAYNMCCAPIINANKLFWPDISGVNN